LTQYPSELGVFEVSKKQANSVLSVYIELIITPIVFLFSLASTFAVYLSFRKTRQAIVIAGKSKTLNLFRVPSNDPN
jgi:hypothetical protein